MEVLYPRCCGLDVHKSSITACALLREQGRIRTERRRFTTMTQEGVDLILDIDLKLREQPSVAGEVLVLRPAPIGH
jgi:hypothetical protein